MGNRRGPQAFWTVEEVADYLSVSIRTVRRWIANRRLIVHEFGNAIRISDSDFRLFLKSSRRL